MSARRVFTTFVTLSVVGTLTAGPLARPAEAQFLKNAVRGGACLGMGVVGFKAGEAMADFEARRLNLAPAQAAKHRRAFQIGMALALCGAAVGITNSVYNRLSKRGREVREREIRAALEDAAPHAYSDPDNPALTGTAVAQPAFVEADGECRIVEDQLSDEEALVKYCRSGPGGEWKLRKV